MLLTMASRNSYRLRLSSSVILRAQSNLASSAAVCKVTRNVGFAAKPGTANDCWMVDDSFSRIFLAFLVCKPANKLRSSYALNLTHPHPQL